MKHKHADIIKAWADGAEIEYKALDGRWNPLITPEFYDWCEFRMKPKQKVARWLWVYKTAAAEWILFKRYMTEAEAQETFYDNCATKVESTCMEFDE